MESPYEKNYINELFEAQESNAKISGLATRLVNNGQSGAKKNEEISDLLEGQYVARARNGVYIDKNKKDEITGQPYDNVDEEAKYLIDQNLQN